MTVKRISDLKIAKRGLLSGIYGNTRNSEYFIDCDLCSYNISKALFLYLKTEGYRVVFYNPTNNIGLYSYTEEDLAVFSGYTDAKPANSQAKISSQENLQSGGNYERSGEYTSYVPKFKTPFGKLKPRFGPRNQGARDSQQNPIISSPASSPHQNTTSEKQLVCHYPQIYVHKVGKNTFFKRQSVSDVFSEVFSYSNNYPEDRMAVIFEIPENITPTNPDQVENQFSEIAKVYGEENRQLKMIVLFGFESNGQLAAAFDREHGGQSGVFFRSSFGTRFGLAASNQQDEAERKVNLANFEKNMFCIDLPQEDEVGNWLIRKRICNGATCTLSPKPFATLQRSISLGNFKLPNKEGKLDFANMDDRMMINLNKQEINLEQLVDTVSADDAEKQLRSMDGLDKVIDQIDNLKNLILNARRQKQETGRSTITVYPHMVFMGSPGTGKTTVAHLVAQWFREENILSKGTFVSATVGDIVGQYIGETRIKAQALCERARGGMLFIDEAYGLREDKSGHGANYTTEAVEVLIQYMTKPDFMLVLAGYKHEMEDLLTNSNPGLRSRINDDQLIMFDDYEPSDLLKILNRNLTHPKTEEFENAIRMLVEVMYDQRNLRTWGNARTMEQLAAQIYKEFFKKNNRVLDECHIPGKFRKMISTEQKTEQEVLQGLNELIGLKNVKDTIKDIYYTMRRNRRRLKEGKPVKEEDLIFIFTGAPGTGKTTVARLLGGILHDLGLLTSGDCAEKKKGDIIDSFAGGTEKKVEQLFADCVGKTLFIDEAYALCENGDRSIVTQIVGLLTDPRYKGKMALVLAGYPADMTRFLSMNSGFKRRVRHIIQFDNYNNEELWQILQLNMRRLQRHFRDEEKCHQLALAWFGLIPRTEDFGNASVSEQLLEQLERNNDHRLRISNIDNVENMDEYSPEDFPEAAHEALANMMEYDDTDNSQPSHESRSSICKDDLPEITLDLTSEVLENRATNVEHLEHSVGLLTCEGGTNPEKTQGTAFIISLRNHYLLTCSHVVEGKTQFTFSISEFQFETPARLLWNNAQCDMALLQVGILPQEARYLELYKEDSPIGKTTDIVLAGYPLGEQVSQNLSVNTGKITNYEDGKLNNDRRFDTYMSDINATHGNSGGPVVRQSDYQVIGLLQGGFEQVQVRLITDIRQLYEKINIVNKN